MRFLIPATRFASWQTDVNTTGVFSVMKAAWSVFTEQQYGRCVVVASPAIYGAGVAAYSASKTAVIGLANSLQFEARKLKMDIKVSAVFGSRIIVLLAQMGIDDPPYNDK